MPDVLEFDLNRELNFDPNREVDFNWGRPVDFDPNRGLEFNPDRDLGFGKRGIVFRGFVCPVCGSGVTETDPSCPQCGAVFEPQPTSRIKAGAAPKPTTPAPASVATPAPPAPPEEAAPAMPRSSSPPAARIPPPPPIRSYPPTPKRIDVHNCPYCGARVSTNDAFCWNCGNRMYAEGR